MMADDRETKERAVEMLDEIAKLVTQVREEILLPRLEDRNDG